jgi:hypothetical protein
LLRRDLSSSVFQLQQAVIDNNTKVTDLLSRALVVATKLKIEDFKNWIRQELNGYGDN